MNSGDSLRGWWDVGVCVCRSCCTRGGGVQEVVIAWRIGCWARAMTGGTRHIDTL